MTHRFLGLIPADSLELIYSIALFIGSAFLLSGFQTADLRYTEDDRIEEEDGQAGQRERWLMEYIFKSFHLAISLLSIMVAFLSLLGRRCTRQTWLKIPIKFQITSSWLLIFFQSVVLFTLKSSLDSSIPGSKQLIESMQSYSLLSISNLVSFENLKSNHLLARFASSVDDEQTDDVFGKQLNQMIYTNLCLIIVYSDLLRVLVWPNRKTKAPSSDLESNHNPLQVIPDEKPLIEL